MNPPADTTGNVVVFAYHDIGVRCLEVLLELGVNIGLVVTHKDQPGEQIWFASAQTTAELNGIPVITPQDPNSTTVIEQITRCQPDMLFSFYYRHMLCEELLGIPRLGAFNVHGSLLPSYRGRVPVNWAIIHGEQETGVSLHRMTAKPDAGNLLAQRAVSILTNDTAADVFQKIKCAAEAMLLDVLPGLLVGRALETPQDLAKGCYFSGRRPEDGVIDWAKPAREIHNLVRAVAPPYPGAFFDWDKHRIWVLGSYFRAEVARDQGARIYYENGQCWADCTDGFRFLITHWKLDQTEITPTLFQQYFGNQLVLDRPVQ